MTGRFLAAALLCVSPALFSGCRTAGDATHDLTDDVGVLISEAGTLAREAVVARQTATLALENALASQDKAEALLLAAFRDRGLEEIRAAKAKLIEATAAADRTFGIVDHVVGLAMEVAKATTDLSAWREEQSRPASEGLKRCVITCREAVGIAKRLAEDLKQEWLVADLSAGAETEKAPPEKR